MQNLNILDKKITKNKTLNSEISLLSNKETNNLINRKKSILQQSLNSSFMTESSMYSKTSGESLLNSKADIYQINN